MPFETPWAKRKRIQVESREGCAGAVDYARRVKLHLDELLRISKSVPKRGVFRQRDYSYVLGLLQEQERLTPPPAAVDLHAGMLELLRAMRSGIRGLDPAGYQGSDAVNRIFDENERIFVESVAGPMERFHAACFPDQPDSQDNRTEDCHFNVIPSRHHELSSTIAGTSDLDPSAVDRARLARFLRHKSREAVPSELMDLEPLSARLDDLARAPDRWDTLSEAWISLLAFHQMLSHAYAEDPARLAVLRTLYLHATRTLGMRSRMALEDDVGKNLDSAASHILALEPFMLVDPDPAVVATAAMDIATLMPLEEGDELTGPKSVARQAQQLIEVDETRAAAMIAGLLLLGDARILPLVNLTWRKLGQAGKNVLRDQQTGMVFAATVEYFLQWIGLVEEDDFGHPAGALGALADGMRGAPRVLGVRRRFPAPFNQSDEEFLANPPFHVVQEWTKEDFARAIEPQLRMAYMRETYDKVMPRVLRAWGLEVGEDESEDQIRRAIQAWTWAASQLAQLNREDDGSEAFPWEQRARSTVARLFRDHPVEPALWQVFEEVNRLEKEAEIRRQRAREHLGSSGYGRLMQAAQHFHLEAEAVMRYVQHRFGLELSTTLMMLQAIRKNTSTGANAATREDATQQR